MLYKRIQLKFLTDTSQHVGLHLPLTSTLQSGKTTHLVCPLPLLFLGDAILVDGFGECRPGWWMLVLRLASKQLITTLGTHIHAWKREIWQDFRIERAYLITTKKLRTFYNVCESRRTNKEGETTRFLEEFFSNEWTGIPLIFIYLHTNGHRQISRMSPT